jgi:DNA-binding NarL/FixJ family response regulator
MLSEVLGGGDWRFPGDAHRAGRAAAAVDVAEHGSGVPTALRSGRLSAREVAVLEELAKGTSTDDIAGKLHVSPHTVRTHIKNILRKLGAHTRAHAVAIAYSEGTIDPGRAGS